ncbi:MAG: tRNA (guanosine(46)-N7)-methyltransferase TrmB, partial [Chitinophagaceae bacterium]
QILQPHGRIHLKTDSPTLYRFTKCVIDLYGLKTITDSDDIYAHGDPGPVLSIKTHYEGLNIAKSGRIHYLCFELPDSILPNKDEELQSIMRDTETDEEEKRKYS